MKSTTFTVPGGHRFVQWVTGLVLNVEEHTVTQSLLAVGRPHDWRALEAFVEYGAWDRDALEHVTSRLLEQVPSYVVELGTDIPAIPSVLEMLLDEATA